MIYNKIIVGLLWGAASALLGCVFTNLVGSIDYDLNLFIISMFTGGFIRGYMNKVY